MLDKVLTAVCLSSPTVLIGARACYSAWCIFYLFIAIGPGDWRRDGAERGAGVGAPRRRRHRRRHRRPPKGRPQRTATPSRLSPPSLEPPC
eukprot:8349611-Pyramimonas_sp.AAC.1